MSLPRLGYKKMVTSVLGVSSLYLSVYSEEASCHVVSCPVGEAQDGTEVDIQ